MSTTSFGCARKAKTPYEKLESHLKGKSQSQRIEYLIKAFEENTDQPTTEAAVRLLAQEKNASVLPLIEQLKKQRKDKKEYAMLALQLIGKPAIRDLVSLFDDELLREDAQAILVVIGEDALIPLLLKLRKTDQKEKKIALIETITFLGASSQDAVEIMLEIFSDKKEDEKVRVKALTVLLLSSGKTKETLEKISREDDSRLGEAASLILKEMREESL